MPGQAIAIVGLACRYPEAPDPESLWDLVLTGRRAFLHIPPSRLDLDDYYSGDRNAADATYWARAALIEGFEHGEATMRQAASWPRRAGRSGQRLVLETAARALDDAGFPGGQGLSCDRTGVIIATAPAVGLADPTAGSICAHFGFHGCGHTVEGAGSASLLAIATACTRLITGELDFALAGGVEIGLDPFDLVTAAKAGRLATDEVRIYDAAPTGFLPGEGCGMVAMMRADDARASGVAGYADIIGCGTACAGEGSAAEPGPEGLLLALRRAYDQAGAAPAEVTFLEGHAAGTACFDTAELTALTTLRAGARQVAALGGIKANIGDTRAAAGVAGLLKAVLAMSAGVLPPSTGCERPHPLLRDSASLLRVLTRPEPWPDAAKSRMSGVTAMGVDGTSAHVLLRRADDHVRRRGAPKKAGTPTRGCAPVPV